MDEFNRMFIIKLGEKMALKTWQKSLILVVSIICFMQLPGRACTTFFLDQNTTPVLGTNYDWHIGSGMIVINQRGVSKKGMQVAEDEQVAPPAWISKYGSLTFNQYGRETPMGGINEAGLVVHTMMLSEGIYPTPDSRRPVKNLQWIQYQLDNCSSVEQVIKNDLKIRIQQKEVPGLHYLVADRSGNCASLEWIKGKLVIHKGNTMPVKVLANNTYDDSVRYLKRHQGFGGTMVVEEVGSMSLDRFVRAAKLVKDFPGQSKAPVLEYAFNILRKVSDRTTRWSIVYDMKNLQIHFKTHSNSQVRSVDLRRFDLSCQGPVKIIDLDARLSGDISDKFTYYTKKMNKQLIKHAFKSTSFSSHIPDEYIDKRSLYPETTTCSQ